MECVLDGLKVIEPLISDNDLNILSIIQSYLVKKCDRCPLIDNLKPCDDVETYTCNGVNCYEITGKTCVIDLCNDCIDTECCILCVEWFCKHCDDDFVKCGVCENESKYCDDCASYNVGRCGDCGYVCCKLVYNVNGYCCCEDCMRECLVFNPN